MQEASQYQQIMADNPNNPFAGDDRLWTRFWTEMVKNPEKSAEAGRTICDEVHYIEIRTPGDRDNILVRPMSELDRMRFKERYEKWLKTQNDEAVEGTPLSEVPIFSRKEVEELRYLNIVTLEQASGLSDSHVKKDRNLFQWREKAKNYLDVALRGREASRLQAEKEALAAKFAAADQAQQDQAAQIRQLQAQLTALATAAAQNAEKGK